MKKVFAATFLLTLTLVALISCKDSCPSDYAGLVDTSVVVLPEIIFVEDCVSEEEDTVFRGAVLRQGSVTVSDTFSLTAAVKTEPEVTEEIRTVEAYKRLIANSSFGGEPDDQDLYIYRYTYKFSEEAKAAGMEMETFCRMEYDLSLDEYREMLIGNLRELLVVTALCEQNGVFYTEADRERLLGGAEAPLFPADEYELQFVFYHECVMRILRSWEKRIIKELSNTPMSLPSLRGNMKWGHLIIPA